MRRIVTSSIVGVLLCGLAAVQSRAADAVRIPLAAHARTLNGSGNNVRHPTWGESGSEYVRVAPPKYADGLGR